MNLRKYKMVRWLFFMVVTLGAVAWSGCGTSQPLAKETKGMSDIDRADHYADRGLSEEAIALYNEVIEKSPDNKKAVKNLHRYYNSIGRHQEAVALLQQQIERVDRVDYHAWLAQDYMLLGEYARSKREWQTVLNKIPENHKNAAIAKRRINRLDALLHLLNNPHQISAVRLQNGINSSNDEYQPRYSADGKKVVFTRLIDGQEDIYVGNLNGDTMAIQPVGNLNTKYNEGAHTVSADGNYIVFTHCNDRYGRGGCDLYEIRRINGSWRKPKAISGNVNTKHWESQPSLSADGRYLYFASNRPGGMGESDIWVSKMEGNEWSSAINIGDVINTAKDEMAPFIHADGQTLYFVSDGHLGLGKKDLFMTQQIGKNTWSKPKNMGTPINDKNDQRDIAVSLDGQSGYFATYDSSDVDIYVFDMPQSLRPTPMTYISYVVLSTDEGQPIDGEITIKSLSDTTVSIHRSFDRHIIIPVPVRRDLSISVVRDGFSFYSENVQYGEIAHGSSPIIDTIFLEPLYVETDDTEEAAPIVLNNIFFKTGSSELLSTSDAEIEMLYTFMQNHPNPIRIVGHTDNVGSEQDNLLLSQARAEAVKKALVKKGIPDKRIRTQGLGKSSPIASNETEAGRKKNRRTEVVIIKQWREEKK